LKDHILERLLGHIPGSYVYDDDDYDRLEIVNETLYRHKVIRINYTTYDLRRGQDSVNPRTHPDIMLLSREDDEGATHPYCYARVVGIFHVDVKYHGPAETLPQPAQRMEILWVRWFDYDSTYAAGWQARRLHRIRYVETFSRYEQFGFVDPLDVIRGVHIIPAFARGSTSRFLGPSLSRSFKEDGIENDQDYAYYYVNM